MIQDSKTAGFDLPYLREDEKLRRLLSSALRSRLSTSAVSSKSVSYQYWDAEYFGLHAVPIFRDSTQEEQAEILRLCSNGLLEEAYFVEKAGVGFMAKMVLLAESTEERMLYALFSSDEATHLAQISRFLPDRPVATDDAFLRFLADLLESQDKAVLLFVLQVVLEGWGLSHYRSLAKDCRDPDLGSMFEQFLQAESQHHATGFALFNQMSVSSASQAATIESLALFLQMVQLGPQRVVAAVERVKGHLSRQQKVKLFEELHTETHSGTRLNLLRSLMRGEGAGIMVRELEERGAFEPFPADRCVRS